MIDFNLKTYTRLLDTLKKAGFTFLTFREYMLLQSRSPEHGTGKTDENGQLFIVGSSINKKIILRHDVDALPGNSLRFARIQAGFGIKGSYYFRAVPQSFDEGIIREIAGFGHEIGYHYENMDTCRGDIKKAYTDFSNNLEKLRGLTQVETICMHGSPRSGFDNRTLWQHYDYHSLGIIGEPYLDIDFNKVAYFTDTGRRWNGNKVSVRDKVKSNWSFNFRSTHEVIDNIHLLPGDTMFTFHPQRWTENQFLWLKELLLQNIKNQVKGVLASR